MTCVPASGLAIRRAAWVGTAETRGVRVRSLRRVRRGRRFLGECVAGGGVKESLGARDEEKVRVGLVRMMGRDGQKAMEEVIGLRGCWVGREEERK